MIQNQQLIDEIRTQLEADERTLNEELRRLATEYAALCREINRRLRKCDDLLKRGLRAEALHLAEHEPKLLDLVNLAEFPLRSDFVELVNLYGLPRPESLSLAVVEALNDAYFDQQPLEKLLDWHRLLAVGQAPLRDRLVVLRKLVTADETNPIWVDDLRTMETARLREVEREAQAAGEAGDISALTDIVSELSTNDWMVPVPAPLLKRIKQRQTSAVQVDARRELETLKDQLDESFSTLNIPHARLLREKWLELQKRAQLTDDAPLVEHVSPILGWLLDEDARESRIATWKRAVSMLEAELDRPQTELETLERQYDQVIRTGQGLPEVLEQRYRARTDSLRLGQHRRRWALIGSVVAAVLLVGLGIGWAFHQRREAEQLASMVAAVDQLIATHEFKTAHDTLTKADRFSSGAAWLQAQQRLADAEQNEKLRRAEFQNTTIRIQNAQTFAVAQVELEKLQSQALTDLEKQTVVRLEDEWATRQRQMINERDAAARPLLEKIASSLKSLSEMRVETLVETTADAQLRQADADLLELGNLLASASPDLGRQRDVLSSRMTALKTAQGEQRRRSAIMNELTANSLLVSSDANWLRKLMAFDGALQNYAQSFPGDARSTAFKHPSQLPFVRAALATQVAIQSWRDFLPQSLSQVEQRKSQVEKLISEAEQAADVPLLPEYSDVLGRVLRREADSQGTGDGIRQAILDMFDKPIMHDLTMLRLKNGSIYYLAESRTYPGNPISFRYLTDYDKTNLKSSLGIKYEDLTVGKTFPAPHVALATVFRKRFQFMTLPKWRTECYSTLKEILTEKEMDPLLKCLLAQQVAEFAGRGDAGLAHGLEPIAKILNNPAIDFSSPWMDPGNDAASANRRRAAESLEQITPAQLDSILPAATAWDDGMNNRLFTKRFVVGWLNRSAAGEWFVATNWRPEGTHRLIRIIPGLSSAADWQEIGKIAADGIHLDQSSDLHEGQLVFAASPVNSPAQISSLAAPPAGMKQ